jgi:hypothetical protein
MLRSVKDLIGYPIETVDGRIGKVKDALFDDRYWRLRYIVADTGTWLPGKKVLLTPYHLKKLETGWIGNGIKTDLTKEQLEGSPDLKTDAPVCMQYEEEYAKYYDLPSYWMDPYLFGGSTVPPGMAAEVTPKSEADRQAHEFRMRQIEGKHLRSAHEILGYHIEAKDDSFGHVEDFIIEEENWRLQYLVIDTTNWLPGGSSLIDIGWAEGFDWRNKTAKVDLLRKQIEMAPRFDPYDPVNVDKHQKLYDYYGKPRDYETPAAPMF